MDPWGPPWTTWSQPKNDPNTDGVSDNISLETSSSHLLPIPPSLPPSNLSMTLWALLGYQKHGHLTLPPYQQCIFPPPATINYL